MTGLNRWGQSLELLISDLVVVTMTEMWPGKSQLSYYIIIFNSLAEKFHLVLVPTSGMKKSWASGGFISEVI